MTSLHREKAHACFPPLSHPSVAQWVATTRRTSLASLILLLKLRTVALIDMACSAGDSCESSKAISHEDGRQYCQMIATSFSLCRGHGASFSQSDRITGPCNLLKPLHMKLKSRTGITGKFQKKAHEGVEGVSCHRPPFKRNRIKTDKREIKS